MTIHSTRNGKEFLWDVTFFTGLNHLFFVCLFIYIPAFVCPANETIPDCECEVRSDTGRIVCTDIRQEDLVNFFRLTRQTNDLDPAECLQLHSFRLSSFKESRVDLTPFIHTQLDLLYIGESDALTNIVGQPLTSNWSHPCRGPFYYGQSKPN